MSDCKNALVRDIGIGLTDILEETILNQVLAVVIQAVSKYVVREQITDLVPYDDENLKLMKTYAGCLVIAGKSKGTIEQYIRELKKFTEFLGGKNLKEITTFDIRNYLAEAKVKGLATASVENIRARLMAFYSWMTDEEYIERNPCRAVKPIKVVHEEERAFTNVEIDSIRNACKSTRDRALIEVLLSSGVRVSELTELKVEDINFNSLELHIRHGKGDKERYTYINDVTAKYLIQYLTEQDINCGRVFRKSKKKDGELVGLESGGVRYILNQIAKKSKVSNVHPHRFRRTFATNLAQRGMALSEIQKLLGHSNINTTMIYVKVDDEAVKLSYKKHTA